MAERFEELKVWRVSRELVNFVYGITDNGAFRKDYGLKDQIRRAAISIPSNIAEGFERGGNKELCQFLYIAKGSAGEVRSQLYLALDQKYISNADFEDLNSLCTDVSNQLSGFINYLKSSELKGRKYKKQES